ncbi:lanthionine synthetase C family protein [Chryseobacterium aquaticum]|uniref:Lanthionine synthetase C family protein n=1 Tax=Chryseobacterium aquaticum TaxID=452084 RepID=A0A848N4B5_9FLAO|nr:MULTISPECIES: lanthionine synthetase C family protein [Chryseobacterium]NMR33765.1 lanthionine synthetase C family protein [Chryseobacterium aquaticum]NRQ45841.1 lanthionine synthetase C family protein [Chryseobacterium sp. C-204]
MEIIFQELERIKTLTYSYIDAKQYKAGLLGDIGGLSLFSFYYGRIFNDIDSLDRGEELTDNIIVNIKNSLRDGNFRYSNGVTGFASLLKFLNKESFVEFEANDVLSDLDEIIFNYAIQELDKGNYDFLHGAMGVLHYFLIDAEKLNDFAKKIISKLHSIVEFTPEAMMYWSFFDVNDPYYKLEKSINLGLAHGQPAIVSVLSKAYKLAPNDIILKGLIENATKTIINYKYQDNRSSLYPSIQPILQNNDYYKGSRMGWCYGDLGIALALWEVGEALADNYFKSEALECIKKSALRKDLQEGSVIDAAICHGSAGIMYIFNKFSQLSNDCKYQDEINYWKEISVNLLNTNKSQLLTGHCAWSRDTQYYNDFGLLQGISGVGLSFLSFVNPEIKWGEFLLM